MAVLSVKKAVLSGVSLGAVAAAGGGDSFANDGRTVLYIKNAAGSPMTLTIDAQSVDGVPLVDPTVVVGAGAEKIVGPFLPRFFNDANGRVKLTYSSATSVTVSPVRV
jgi:hypothetical protein